MEQHKHFGMKSPDSRVTPRTRRKKPIPGECLARRLIAKLEKWPKGWPSADVEQLRVALRLHTREMTMALGTAGERGWISMQATKAESVLVAVSLTGDGWTEAARQRQEADSSGDDVGRSTGRNAHAAALTAQTGAAVRSPGDDVADRS